MSEPACQEVSINHLDEIVEDNTKMMPVAFQVHVGSSAPVSSCPGEYSSFLDVPVSYGAEPEPVYSSVLQDQFSQQSVVASKNIFRRKKHDSELLAKSRSSLSETFYKATTFQQLQQLQQLEASSDTPKRRNVKISEHPQSILARQRRERISQKIRTLRRLVPGVTKLDTASMLDGAIHYVKFLKMQVKALEMLGYAADASFNPTAALLRTAATSV